MATPDLSCIRKLRQSCSNARCLSHWARPGVELHPHRDNIMSLTCWATTGTPSCFFKKENPWGVPWWLSGLRIRYCHCCGTGLIPGLGTSTCHKCSKKRKKRKKNPMVIIDPLFENVNLYDNKQRLLPFISYIYCFLGLPLRHMEVPWLGVKLELELPACTTAHGNAIFLIHWVRPGIEPASSWIPVRLLTAEPQWELPRSCILSIR